MSSDKISLNVKTIQKYLITKLYLVNCNPENIKVVKMIKGYKEGSHIQILIPNWYMAIATLYVHILLRCWLDKIHLTLKAKTNKPKSLSAQKAKAKGTKPKLSHSAQKAKKARKPKFISHKRPSWNSFPKRRPPLLPRNIPPKRRSLKLSGGLLRGRKRGKAATFVRRKLLLFLLEKGDEWN